jgi:fibronectin-binding autotransporter adhesin
LSGAITLNKDAIFDITQVTAGTHDRLSLSGAVGGTGGIVKTGTGLLILSNATNSFGGLQINAGQVTLQTNATVTGLSGSGGSLALAGGTLTVNAAASSSYGQVISGAGALTKSGGGTMTLGGTNTYGGATTVSAGSLIVNGNQSGATGLLTVAQNATLGGSGTIGGATTISGNLQPGNSPGILTFSSGLTLTGTAVTTMEINGLARGTDYDVINVVGGLLTYDGRLTLSLSGPVYGIGIYSFDLFDFVSQTGSFDVVELLGSYSGSLTNNGSGVWGLSSGNDTWSFSQADGVLTLDVVPEPSTYALLVLSAAGLAAHVVRRRRRLPR